MKTSTIEKAAKIDVLKRQFLTNRQIAKILGVSPSLICIYCKQFNIPKYYRSISKEQEEIIFGSLLGDSTIYKGRDSREFEFVCQHGPKQEEYIKWKAEKLKSLGIFLKFYKRSVPNKKTGKLYTFWILRSNTNSEFSRLEKYFYKRRKKYISNYVLSKYTDLSLAVHYMDDGNSAKRSSYALSTDCFSWSSLLRFKKFLRDKWNIECIVEKNHKILIRTKSKYIFDSLIRKYVEQIPSMTYKLIVSKQGELLEKPTTNKEVNQQPSLLSNEFEGSTTNSRVQMDSNANTSALHSIK